MQDRSPQLSHTALVAARRRYARERGLGHCPKRRKRTQACGSTADAAAAIFTFRGSEIEDDS